MCTVGLDFYFSGAIINHVAFQDKGQEYYHGLLVGCKQSRLESYVSVCFLCRIGGVSAVIRTAARALIATARAFKTIRRAGIALARYRLAFMRVSAKIAKVFGAAGVVIVESDLVSGLG